MKKLFGLIGKLIGLIFMVSAFLTWISYDYPDFVAFSPRGMFPSFFDQIGLAINWGLVVIQGTIGVYLWKLQDYLN
jgi:hypothetical protein